MSKSSFALMMHWKSERIYISNKFFKTKQIDSQPEADA
jgi:hypothetical protein